MYRAFFVIRTTHIPSIHTFLFLRCIQTRHSCFQKRCFSLQLPYALIFRARYRWCGSSQEIISWLVLQPRAWPRPRSWSRRSHDLRPPPRLVNEPRRRRPRRAPLKAPCGRVDFTRFGFMNHYRKRTLIFGHVPKAKFGQGWSIKSWKSTKNSSM